MILTVSHIFKSFGSVSILNDASFLVNEHDKIAIVGLNGAGKTTLLNILGGIDHEYSGTVTIAKDTTLGYLQQLHNLDSTLTIEEELLKVIKPILDMESDITVLHNQIETASPNELDSLYEKYNSLTHQYELLDGYSARSRVLGIIKGLGFSDEDKAKPICTLSGGQKTRVSLGKLLLESPDIIMLDEPTNHLDLNGIEWLEGYLRSYPGAVIIVSHDRYFMDKTVERVIEIESAKLTVFNGNYTSYATKKEALRESALRAYENQQQSIRHQEAVIEKLKSFNREKSIKRAESREKMLEKLERIDKPSEIKSDMKLDFSRNNLSGQDVLMVDNITKRFDDLTLFDNLTFEIKRGEHVAIIGANGTGKTTILKILTGMIPPDSGDLKLGTGVMIAYYDQEQQVLDDAKTVFQELQDAYPQMDNTSVRNTLAAFLFTGDDVFKLISDLSGGERGRLSLAKLMLSGANFIVLDEPTNHLDMAGKEILESAIRRFDGTILYVSHDRYFINTTATRILHLENSKLYNYIGNYDYYLEKRDIIENEVNNTISSPNADKDAAIAWKQEKERTALLKKQQKALTECEDKITSTEAKIKEVDTLYEDPEVQCDVGKLCELQKQRDELSSILDTLYSKWEELSDESNN